MKDDKEKFLTKWSGIALVVNLFLFVGFLFAYNYTVHTGHWAQGAWLTLLWSSAMTKIVMSIIFLAHFFSLEAE